MKNTKKCVLVPIEKYERMMKRMQNPDAEAAKKKQRPDAEPPRKKQHSTPIEEQKGRGDVPPPPGLPAVTSEVRDLHTPPMRVVKKKRVIKVRKNSPHSWMELWQKMT